MTKPLKITEKKLWTLSRAERRVMTEFKKGLTGNRGIGEALGLEESTVKYHMSNIYKKLGIPVGTQFDGIKKYRTLMYALMQCECKKRKHT